jgi:hypothetical protein
MVVAPPVWIRAAATSEGGIMEEHTRPGGGGRPVPARAIRASDAERERIAALLNRHHVDGRLTAEEFSERIETALGARTREELDALLVDLPSPEPSEPARPASPEPSRRRPGPPVVALVLLGLAMLGAFVGWAAGWGRFGGPPFPFFPFFPLIPLLFWGIVIRWAVFGSRWSRPPLGRQDR